MYGIVNKAIHHMILESHGEDAWQKIAMLCNIEQDGFLSSESYSDEITYRLVSITAEQTGISAADILKRLGEFWILNTGMKSYGLLMKAGGNNLREFMLNLPNFHSRVMLIYPKLTPPEFEVTAKEDNSLLLHYYSNREGLAPFVEGLILGLAKMHRTNIHLESLAVSPEAKQKASFRIMILHEEKS